MAVAEAEAALAEVAADSAAAEAADSAEVASAAALAAWRPGHGWVALSLDRMARLPDRVLQIFARALFGRVPSPDQLRSRADSAARVGREG